jgi:hypothetical protein
MCKAVQLELTAGIGHKRYWAYEEQNSRKNEGKSTFCVMQTRSRNVSYSAGWLVACSPRFHIKVFIVMTSVTFTKI